MKMGLYLIELIIICLVLFPVMGYTQPSKVIAEVSVNGGYGEEDESDALPNETVAMDSPWSYYLGTNDLELNSGQTVVSPVIIFYPNADLLS